MAQLVLVIGNRNYSSWSLRAWLALRQSGLEFDEEQVPLDLPNTAERLRGISGAARVPVLRDGDLVVWDSLAILEYLAERFPDRGWWPEDPNARAVARAVSAEMHSSFTALRGQAHMNVRAEGRRLDFSPETLRDIERILEIWRDCRARYEAGGDFLFGGFGIADAMYAPVVSRFRTYGVTLDGVEADYAEAVWQTPGMVWWRSASAEESWTIPGEEVG